MRRPLLVDTGGLLRALAATPDGEPAWPTYEEALRVASVVFVPALVLAEVDYFLRADRPAMHALLREILDAATTYELDLPDGSDLARAVAFDRRFADLGLGLVDGLVAATAEKRRVYRILTTDRRHFSAIRVGPRFDRALTLLPEDEA